MNQRDPNAYTINKSKYHAEVLSYRNFLFEGNPMDKHFESRVRNLKVILNNYLDTSHNQLDLWLADFFRKNKKYGSKDRRFYRDNMFGILRSHGLLLFSIDPSLTREKFSNIDTPDQLNTHIRSLDLANVVETLPRLQEILPDLLNELDHSNLTDLAIACSSDKKHAQRLQERIESSYVGKEQSFLKLLHSQPKAWIRINDPKQIQNLEKEAHAEDVEISQSNDVYFLSQSPKIKNFKTFRNGVFDFQDIASQKLIDGIPEDLMPKNIWDACAGAGGKSLALANKFPKARIFSSDTRSHKISELQKRAKTQRITNIKAFTQDATKEISVDLAKNYAIPKFDLILIDAPCSSSGVLRRSPDTKFRITDESLDDLQKIQLDILENAFNYLSPKGCIIYSTCSVYEKENEQIVEKFMESHSQLEIYEMKMEGSPDWDSDSMFKSVLVKK